MSDDEEEQEGGEVIFIDKGLRAPIYFPEDPQTYLWRSTHPYSPFQGNALTWESYVYDDATTYEGLCREECPHGLGVLCLGKGGGGGIQRTKMGDRYEGEFYGGFAHGLGMLSSRDGTVYRGEFHSGKKQGCGMQYKMAPYHNLIKKGEKPEVAWEKAKEKIYANAKYGTWRRDYFVADPDNSGTGRFCHINEIKGTLQELDAVLTKARMFRYKPDGDVTFRFTQDKNSNPLPMIQDPLHYPFNTKFMAPGPMGQCFPIPDNENIRREMVLHARNYKRIHDMYNFEYDPTPGSDMWKAERWYKKAQEKRKELVQSYMEKQRRRKQLQERASRARAKKEREEKRSQAAKAAGSKPDGSSAKQSRPTSSITLGLLRNAGAVGQLFERAALMARPMPRLVRPSMMKSNPSED